MSAVALLVFGLVALGLPEAEPLIPDRIGPLASITGAGVGAVLGGIFAIRAPTSRRETAVKWGALAGLVAGAALYCLALIVQVV